MKRILLCFGILWGFSPVVNAQAQSKDGGTSQLSPQRVAEIASAFDRWIGAPDTFRFGQILAAPQAGEPLLPICGTMDGKNDFGEWVGFRVFIAIYDAEDNDLIAPQLSENADFDAILSRECQKMGIEIIAAD
ncbi:hypothetical protein [Puniceibacterium sp. IMCC21224]|uniref:hypothetical protein n=1 Tax=Puniceibacterium sp. IMCC21224 TaxID=1618204 RepID=UPI00064D9FC4|nr:hypothetical protein [Puniceibacterium sp. IMCC21224]KMK68548.1 hypothetical protein IMCC21224_113431 [Puniceibacterium sp. IMCC21224]